MTKIIKDVHDRGGLKTPLHIVEERRRCLAEYVQQHAYAPLKDVCTHFGTSEATARRDLAVLVARNQIVRTHGGAISDYIGRFPSFRERRARQATAKRKIAVAAREIIQAGTTCYLDFGTTIYALAEELQRRPVADLRVVTNNLPVAELLAGVPGMRVYLLGGELLARQSVLLGGPACKALRFHSIDQAFLGAEAADVTGVWNSQSELVTLQRKVLEDASSNVLCLDASKFKHTAPALLSPWVGFDLVLTDANATKVEGMAIPEVRFV